MVVDQVLVMVLILLLQRLKVIFLKNNLCFVPFKPPHEEVQVQSRALRSLSFPYVGSPGGQSSACGVSRLFPFLCTWTTWCLHWPWLILNTSSKPLMHIIYWCTTAIRWCRVTPNSSKYFFPCNFWCSRLKIDLHLWTVVRWQINRCCVFINRTFFITNPEIFMISVFICPAIKARFAR